MKNKKRKAKGYPKWLKIRRKIVQKSRKVC